MKHRYLMACILLAGNAIAWAVPDWTEQSGEKGSIKYEKAQGVTDPVLVHKVTPKYPEEARKALISGEVILEGTIAKEGTVTDTKVQKSPDALLSQAAEDALKQWKFEPARNTSGEPVPVRFTVTVRFRLK